MKKILILITLAAATLTASAQFRYGPQIGVNRTNMHFKQTIVDVEPTFNPSAALACEFIFNSWGLGLDFGLGYSATGAKINLGQKPIWSLQGYGNERVMIHNLQIPLHLRWKCIKLQGFEDYLAPFIYGGPDFNIQVAHTAPSHDGTDAFKFSGGDVALTAGIGFEVMKRWQVSWAYSWSVTYALRTSLLENYSARTRGWNIKLAYFF